MDDRTKPVVGRRYSASHLCDIVYGIQPMTIDLAETIRMLRRDHSVDYTDLGFHLCESTPDQGALFGLGRSLTELASNELQDKDPSWI